MKRNRSTVKMELIMKTVVNQAKAKIDRHKQAGKKADRLKQIFN